MAKSVCIMGAGPAGLVAAKTLAHDFPKGTFHVTIFEQTDRIGGLWPLSVDDEKSLINPLMYTNGSRHLVSFSDLAWHDTSPMFPRAWQVGQYLKRYLDKYQDGIDLKTNARVVNTARSSSSTDTSKRWKVDVRNGKTSHPLTTTPGRSTAASSSELPNGVTDETSPLETHYFDHLIVASGFFGKGNVPEAFQSSSIPVQHTLQFRHITSLLAGRKEVDSSKGGKILVVGGSFSGVETAASIASQLSSEVSSPGEAKVPHADKYKVHHVMSRALWVAPLFLPTKTFLDSDNEETKIHNPAPTFLPADLVFYDLSKRAGELKNRSGRLTVEYAQNSHKTFEGFLGNDQLFTPAGDNVKAAGLQVYGDFRKDAAWLSISDLYNSYVRAGDIATSIGRLVKFASSEDGSATATVVISQDGKEETISDVAAIVLGTGFDSSSSLSFLPPDVLEILQHDSKCNSFPLILNQHAITSRSLPDLGFVGYYRGPFWEVMEMQARFLGKLWSGDEKAQQALEDEKISPLESLRKSYYEEPNRLAQFPMGDYTWTVERFKDILGVDRAPLSLPELLLPPPGQEPQDRSGPVTPSRYTLSSSSTISKREARVSVSQLEGDLLASSTQYKFVARAIFRGWHGTWNLKRTLTSRLASYPSGTFRGTARFLWREPTGTRSDEGDGEKPYDGEYLYIEEGEFETETGLRFNATRRYAYRYHALTDTLSAWFIKPTNDREVDYLFHELEILPPLPPSSSSSLADSNAKTGSGWRARSTQPHLCVEDTYDVEYEFRFKGVSLENWRLAYGVRGPSKDYGIVSFYERP